MLNNFIEIGHSAYEALTFRILLLQFLVKRDLTFFVRRFRSSPVEVFLKARGQNWDFWVGLNSALKVSVVDLALVCNFMLIKSSIGLFKQ